MRPLDCIYVAASPYDARYTRICIASIRRFYPHIPIRLLAGGKLDAGLLEELETVWNVTLADLPEGDWGWGFIKLEPLFGSPGETFLVLDSDTVLCGPVIDIWQVGTAPFLVDDESQTVEQTNRLYYDWKAVRRIDKAATAPAFVFNTGQWFGTSAVLRRADFSGLIDWNVMPPRMKHPDLFMPGDQGVLNYVLNQKCRLAGLQVERRRLMRWPGHGLGELGLEQLRTGTAPPVVIHWAGMKSLRLNKMEGGDLLEFFEDSYYARIPNGGFRRFRNLYRHAAWTGWRWFATPWKLRLQRLVRLLHRSGTTSAPPRNRQQPIQRPTILKDRR